MATHVIGDYVAANSIDGSTNYLLIQPGNSSTAYNKINRNTLLGITGQPMDISSSQSVTNKTLDNTNTVTLKDTLFTLQDDGDTTKQARFQLSGITTATTRTYTLPNASSTLADIATAQTLTNKTLTAPVINNGSITGTTITTDAIVGQSAGTSGTVYGLAITSSKISGASITNATIGTGALATNAVQGNQLATNAISIGYAQITTNFTTTTTNAFVDVTGLTVTVTVPAGSRNLRITTQFAANTSASAGTIVGGYVREGSTVVGSIIWNQNVVSDNLPICFVSYIAAPSSGSHTYKVSVSENGAGTLSLLAGTANPAVSSIGPAFILVEAI